jgi:hypothetical protein
MIRPFTCLCLAAACGSGLYLYSEKHRTALLDRQIATVVHETEAARQRTGLLRAEWALLNEPGRLQDMADKYLSLKPMAPTQFVQLSDLASRLPAPAPAGAALADDGTDEDGGADTQGQAVAAGPAQPGGRDAGADALSPGATALNLPARQIEPKPAPKLLAHADTRPDAKPADAKAKTPPHRAYADRAYAQRDGLLAHGAPLPLAAPQPVGARVYSALARPSATAYRAPVVVAAPRYVSPYVGSALGGGGSLPPPVPYSGER